MKHALSYILGFIAAIVIPSLLMIFPYAINSASQDDGYEWARIASFSTLVIVYAAIPAIIGGIPLIWILRNFKAIFWWSATLGGFLIATTFYSIAFWPSPPAATHASHSDGGRIIVTVADGVVTLDGWIDFFEFAAMLGALGALGGLSFWLVWRLPHLGKGGYS